MNIYESIAAIMLDVPAIGKGKRNKEQGFLYRGIDDVMNALQPLLSKHKVFVVPEVLEQTREERTTKGGKALLYSVMRIKYTFFAEDGSSVSAVVVGEGMDLADKASNKAMAVALKYALFQVFCIPTEEMVDPDSETPEPSEPTYYCEDCTLELKPVTMKDGSVWAVKDFAAYTKQTFGRQLCADCYKKAVAAARAAKAAEEAKAAGEA